MYKMIIVDDEIIIREGLRNVIDWASIDVEVIACLSDGTEALEFFKHNEVDVILSDIVMPFMDGIMLSKNIREIDNEVRIIIISAYQELDYIRAAFKYEAFDYILKPFKNEILLDVVVRSIKKLEQLRESTHLVNKIKNNLNESLPAIRKQFWRDVINNRQSRVNKIRQTADLINLPFAYTDNIRVIICNIDKEEGMVDEKIIKTNIENLLYKENFVGLCEKTSVSKYIVVLVNENNMHSTISIISDKIKTIFNRHDILVTVGIGTPKVGIDQVHQSYEEAEVACGHRMLQGTNKVINYNDIKNSKISQLPSKIKTISNDIGEWLETSEIRKVLNGIHLIFEQMRTNGIYSQSYVYHICSEIYSIVYQMSTDAVNDTIYNEKNFINELSSIICMQEAEDLMINLLLAIDKCKKDISTNTNYKVINTVKKIIKSNYMKKLQLIDIANHVHLTPSYVVTLFKKETGKTINDYLTCVRIKQAKELLHEMDMSTADVSEAVGYSDYRYFSRVFKKHMGITPSGYRKSLS